jgi:predicted kinase
MLNRFVSARRSLLTLEPSAPRTRSDDIRKRLFGLPEVPHAEPTDADSTPSESTNPGK